MTWLRKDLLMMLVLLTSTEGLRQDIGKQKKTLKTQNELFSSQAGDVGVKETQNSHESNHSVLAIAVDTGTEDCNLTVSETSKGHFHYIIAHEHLNFVFIHLKFSPEINGSIANYVVDGLVWTWTYIGNNGGFPFLQQPPEVSVWSLGLLYHSIGGVIDSLELTLETNGCKMNIEIGNETSTYKIGHALKDIRSPLYTVDEDLRANFWCYWKRRWIPNHWLYILCLHVVCPLPHVEYRCCARHFSPKNMTWDLDCSSRNTFVNNFVWYIPFISGCIFF